MNNLAELTKVLFTRITRQLTGTYAQTDDVNVLLRGCKKDCIQQQGPNISNRINQKIPWTEEHVEAFSSGNAFIYLCHCLEGLNLDSVQQDLEMHVITKLTATDHNHEAGRLKQWLDQLAFCFKKKRSIEAKKQILATEIQTLLCFVVTKKAEVLLYCDESKRLFNVPTKQSCTKLTAWQLECVSEENKISDIPARATNLTNTVRVLLSAYIPGSHRYVEFTRYTLYLLCRHFYPNIDSEAFGITNESASQEESEITARNTSNAFGLAQFNDELLDMRKTLHFCVPTKNKNAANHYAKKLLVSSDLPPMHTEQICQYAEEVLDLLLEIYTDLPDSFHNNIVGKYKVELNTTVSDFILFMAYQGAFRSELGQAKLLDISRLLVATHNHHHSYMYSFFEKSAVDNRHIQVPLFRQFDPENAFSRQVVEIVEQLYEDIFLTTHTHIHWGNNFVGWINTDPQIVQRLLAKNCYDSAVWLAYRDLAPSNGRVLQTMVTDRLLAKSFDLRNSAFTHHLLSFIQLIAKLNIRGSAEHWLLFARNNPEYSRKMFWFMKDVLIHLPSFPKCFWETTSHALVRYLSNLPKDDHELTQRVFIQACANADWSHPCYSKHFLSRKASALSEEKNENNQDIEHRNAVQRVKSCARQIRVNNAPSVSAVLSIIKAFIHFNGETIDHEAHRCFDECLHFVLNSRDFLEDTPDTHRTILRCNTMFLSLESATQRKLIDHAVTFLSMDHITAKTNTIIHALKILGKDNQKEHLITLEHYFTYYAAQNSSKNYDNLCVLIAILELYIQSSTTRDSLVQKLRDDPLYINTIKTLCDPSKSYILKDAIKSNRLLYLFFCDLLSPTVFWSLGLDAQLGLAHFAKKNRQLRQHFSALLDDAVVNWDAIKGEKVRYALVSHISDFYESNERLMYVGHLLEELLEEAKQDLRSAAKKCGAMPETFLFHLVRLFKDHPEKTAILCAWEQVKLLAQMRYEAMHPDASDMDDIARRERRKGFLCLAIANPSIRQFSLLYCRQMRDVILDNPNLHYEDILDTLNKAVRGDFPLWEADLCDVPEYTIEPLDIPVMSIDISYTKYTPSKEKLKDLSDKEGSWNERFDPKTGVFTPRFNIIIFKQSDGTFEFIDGKNTMYWLQDRALKSGDRFAVRVLCLSLRERITL